MDYYTNARFTLDQEIEADMFALRVMNECGLSFTTLKAPQSSEDNGIVVYRKVLQILESENDAKKVLQESVPLEKRMKLLDSYIKESEEIL